ncbi:serine/threonine protein kinase [Nocardioides seonyuensis]|uniref:non-specific serine/threonine protein kinase n=1 Tax=Nocardioides seonyuensis TaxID=2518371 RepID=A0A4P7IF61_9ACTN|nr:serine/threonine protein kinase [Nocardioides seonyuensis]
MSDGPGPGKPVVQTAHRLGPPVDGPDVRRRPRLASAVVTTPRLPGADASRRQAVVAGRYVLQEQIGMGGMGSVWRARDQRTGSDVAVKVLGQHSGALLARFVREQAIRIRHPHVVAPTGWAAEDDLVVLVMDLVPGGSVADLLREHGPLPAGYAAVLVEQLLLGLAAVHGAGLVHRDVKPANLLLEATGSGRPHLRLGDFGVAGPIADRRFTTVPGAIGTDGYMAPEQARGASPDPCQDLYAVGRVVLQMVTGQTATRQIAPQDDPLPSHPLRPLIERLLVPDPEHRLATAEAALRLLRRLDIPAEAGPAVPDRLGTAPRRHTDWWGWAAVAGLCVVIAVSLAVLVAVVR